MTQAPASLSRAERWFPRAATIAAAFTAFCCLGLSAALSLASAVGASFFLRDETLRPLLLGTLLLTVLASVLTFRRHRNPRPLLVTVAASIAVYLLIFGVGGSTEDQGHGAHTANADGSGSGEPFGWVALAVLVGAQVWDVAAVRRCRRSALRVPS